MGSPPLARELHDPVQTGTVYDRITPARAGITGEDKPVKEADQDHPRSRGNYSVPAFFNSAISGSPPLARELPSFVIWNGSFCRITPARAGITTAERLQKLGVKDHPRSRGNYSVTWISFHSSSGSPPLARELPCKNSTTELSGRITPARAGITYVRVPGLRVSQDHPRSRGNYHKVFHHEV